MDVGSNSVRMVVFEGGRRCPSTLFNEKVSCGLGADLAETGKLSPKGVERAMRALHRFVALAPELQLSALTGVATAAVRDAEDGDDFCQRVLEETGIRLTVASGAEEARLAAQGVIFGDPSAAGLVVDLGGASMELCPVNIQGPGLGVSTPLGPQRLGDLSDLDATRRLIAETLDPYARRFAGSTHRIYLVGGAWRAFARVQIAMTDYPFGILHELTFTPEEAAETIAMLISSTPEELRRFSEVPSGRLATLPHAGVLLEQIVQVFGPTTIMISGFGLREGVCYDNFSPELRREDPLFSSVRGHEKTRARAPGFGRELAGWILPVVDPADEREERLIRAVCHLVDVSWRSHPDFRGTSCIETVARANISSAGHQGRAFMLAALLARYKGSKKTLSADPSTAILDETQLERARQAGLLMRLGATLAGSMPGQLRYADLSRTEEELLLTPTGKGRALMGEEVEKRLGHAAKALGLTPRVEN